MTMMGRQHEHRKPDKQRNATPVASVKALAIVVLTVIAIVRQGPAYNDLFFYSQSTTRTATANSSSSSHTVLVLYSGPATLEGEANKVEFYRRNFEFFLLHGIDCTQQQDVIITLGRDVAPLYREQLSAMNQECQEQQQKQQQQQQQHQKQQIPAHTITLVERDNECYDMESVRLVMYGNITNITNYDYFVYVNCGTSGPYIPPSNATSKSLDTPPPYWIDKLIAPMLIQKKVEQDEQQQQQQQQTNMSSSRSTSPKIVMTGLSHYCENDNTHVQSMVYALNKVGMHAIMESDCVYDCRPVKEELLRRNMSNTQFQNIFQGSIINRYERGMGKFLLNRGYAISTLTRTKVITKDNRSNCTDKDMWLTDRLKEEYGAIPSLEQFMFFKTSRILTPETAKVINFTGKVWWNW